MLLLIKNNYIDRIFRKTKKKIRLYKINKRRNRIEFLPFYFYLSLPLSHLMGHWMKQERKNSLFYFYFLANLFLIYISFSQRWVHGSMFIILLFPVAGHIMEAASKHQIHLFLSARSFLFSINQINLRMPRVFAEIY